MLRAPSVRCRPRACSRCFVSRAACSFVSSLSTAGRRRPAILAVKEPPASRTSPASRRSSAPRDRPCTSRRPTYSLLTTRYSLLLHSPLLATHQNIFSFFSRRDLLQQGAIRVDLPGLWAAPAGRCRASSWDSPPSAQARAHLRLPQARRPAAAHLTRLGRVGRVQSRSRPLRRFAATE